MNLSTPVSCRQFAKMVGQAESAVRKAVGRQSILKGKTPDGKFIPDIASVEWGKEILREFLPVATVTKKPTPLPPIQKKPVHTKREKPDPVTAADFVQEIIDEPVPKVSQDEVDEFDEDNPEVKLTDKSPKTEAERRTAIYKAKMAEIAYLEKKGDMIPRHKMRVLFEYGAQIRSAMLGIPDKVIDNILAVADDRQKARRLLLEEIEDTLNLLSDPEQFEL